MAKPPKLGGRPGASATVRQEPSPPLAKLPHMALVRATIDYNARGEHVRRGQVLQVDLRLSATKEALRRTWIVPLPAHLQPGFVPEEEATADGE